MASIWRRPFYRGLFSKWILSGVRKPRRISINYCSRRSLPSATVLICVCNIFFVLLPSNLETQKIPLGGRHLRLITAVQNPTFTFLLKQWNANDKTETTSFHFENVVIFFHFSHYIYYAKLIGSAGYRGLRERKTGNWFTLKIR